MVNLIRSLSITLACSLLLLLAACGGGYGPVVVPTVNVPVGIPTVNLPAGINPSGSLPIKLISDSNSGQTGGAVLTEVSGKVTVVVGVTGEPAGATEPMHIHEGSCGPTLGKVVYTLSPVVNGASTTTVDVTLDKLKSAKYAINAHKSATEMGVYVLCGNITP